MKKIIFIVMIFIILGSYVSAQAIPFEGKSGSVIVILEGKVALSIDSSDCENYSGQHELFIFNQKNELIVQKYITTEIVTVSILNLSAGIYRLSLISGKCNSTTTFVKQP